MPRPRSAASRQALALSVTKDIDAVLRKIEHWHQGSIATFKIMYRDEHGGWNGIRWNGNMHPFSLCAKPMRKRRWQNCCAKMQSEGQRGQQPYSFNERRRFKKFLLPEPERAHVRRQSRERLYRKILGKHRHTTTKTQTYDLSLYKLAGEKPRQMGPRHRPNSHEALPVG